MLLCTLSSIPFLLNAYKDLFFIQTLNRCVLVPEWFNQELYKLVGDNESEKPMAINFDYDRPLFDYYPGLKKRVPHVSFATLPTPVVKLKNIEKDLNIASLYIKQDSKAGMQKNKEQLFGGNKVRKLEFLLADACDKRAKTVMTFGCAGSNHVLATCTYAQELGLGAIALLMPQPKNYTVQRNLLLDKETGAELQYYPNKKARSYGACHAFLYNKKKHGDFPYVIPTGGSCPVGVLGFVNAAFELNDQIKTGLLPMPDYIVVPAGSYGTVAGLLLGCRMAGMCPEVYSVSVEPEELDGANRALIQRLFSQTNALLSKGDNTIPLFEFPNHLLHVINDFSGEEYGASTQEAQAAITMLSESNNIYLDPTYSGKGFACVVAYARRGKLEDKNVLFWNTYSEYTLPMQKVVDAREYKKLPKTLHCYFE